MTTNSSTPFNCPNCDALYHLVHAEGGPDSSDSELTCLRCGGPLQGRKGRFVLKYFFVDKDGVAGDHCRGRKCPEALKARKRPPITLIIGLFIRSRRSAAICPFSGPMPCARRLEKGDCAEPIVYSHVGEKFRAGTKQTI